jgi:Ca-activated chloride channel family protein
LRIFFCLQVGNVEEVLDLVKSNNKASRTFGLGIGSDVSQGLVRGIARMGYGTSLFCSLDERLETKVQQQLANCLQPALQGKRMVISSNVFESIVYWL